MSEEPQGTTGVAPAAFPDLGPGAGDGPQGPMELLGDVELDVTVELGRVRKRVRDVLSLQVGSVVELNQVAGSPVDVLVNSTLVARGEVVVVGDELGVRITEIVDKRN